MNQLRRQSGFTLVELVACLVILGILGAFAVPKLVTNTSLAERTYSHEIASAVRAAQTLAVGSGCSVAIILNAGDYAVRLRSAAGNRCSSAGAWSMNGLRADGTPLANTAPANITLAPATQIVFDTRGRPSSGMPPLLHIGAYALRVDPLSGFVTLQ